MHDCKQPWSLTETKDDKALFLLGVIRIINDTCVRIKKNRRCFGEADSTFIFVDTCFDFVPCKFKHNYITIMYPEISSMKRKKAAPKDDLS